MATDTQTIQPEDVAGVRSRVSWGAVAAGSVLAIACSLILTFFFAAVGLSLGAADVRSDAINIGAIVAAIVTICVSLWIGGWAVTQLTAGETAREAVIYGILTWAVVTGFTLMMAGVGVRAGYYALVGGTLVAQNSPAAQQPWDQSMRDAGFSNETINRLRTEGSAERVRAEANNPATREEARKAAVIAAWAALVGSLLAVGSAICGAMVGRGPAFRFFPAATPHRTEIIIAR